MFRAQLPRVRLGENTKLTSEQTSDYNCLAWALGLQRDWIWPSSDPKDKARWPASIPRDDSVAAIRKLFILIGYQDCSSSELVLAVEKIAIYKKDDEPSHVARQLSNGKWASKIGDLADVEHVCPETVGGGAYGDPVIFMARAITQTPPPIPELLPPKKWKLILP